MKSETKKAGWLLGGAAAIASGLYLLFRKKPASKGASASAAPTSPEADAAPSAEASTPTAPPSSTKPKHGITMAQAWHVADADKHFVKHYYPNFGPFAGKVFWSKNAKAAAAMYKMYGEHFAKGQPVPPMRSATATQHVTSAPVAPAIPPVDSHIVPGAEDPAFTPPAAPGAPPPLDPTADGTQSPGSIAALAAQMQQGANAGASVIDAISTFGDTEPQS